MRPSKLSIYELFAQAFLKGPRELRERLDAQQRGPTVPRDSELIGFTLTGADRYPTETAAYEASWSAGRKANPVPVFRATRR